MDIVGLARRTRGDFVRRWRLVFGWQLLVQMTSAAALAPLAGWLLNHVVARSGSAVVSNYDIVTFVLSPRGVVFVLVALVAAVALNMAQFAGHTWIAGHAIAGRPLTLWGTVGAVWERIALLVGLGLRMCLRVIALALPLLAILGLVWLLTLRGHDINYYLAEKPAEWRRAVLVAAALGALYGVLVLRQFAYWLFALPIALFDRSRSPEGVLEASRQMLQGRLWRSILPLIAWWAGLSLAAMALLWSGRQVTDRALDWAGVDVHRVLPLVALFLAVGVTFGFLYSTLQLAVHQFLVTRIYAERMEISLRLPAAVDAEAEAIGRRQGRAIVLALAGVAVLACGIGGVLFARLDLREDVAVTAHRGASREAPENSMAAFRAAHAAGATYVELDVQRARDGTIVVVHDADLMRLAGDARKVRDLTRADLGTIDIGARRGERFAGERVPTLEQVVAFARGRLRLNIELKYNVPDPGLAPAVVELLRREHFADQVVVTSLDHAALRQVERIAPELETGLIVTAAVGNVAGVDTDFVSLNSARAKADLVRRVHAAGKAVHVWTVNDPEVMLRMLERDVDNVITDDPARLVQLMQQRNALSTAEQLGLGLRALFAEPPPELQDERAVPPL